MGMAHGCMCVALVLFSADVAKSITNEIEEVVRKDSIEIRQFVCVVWAASFCLKQLGFFELSERGEMYPNSKELYARIIVAR